MKNKWIFLGVFALFVLTECHEQQKNVPNAMGLRGNVKSLHSQTYDANVVFDNLMEERIWNEFYNFNRNGNLTEQRSYDTDNRLSGRSVCKYEKGICVKETNYNPEGEVSGSNTNVYDEMGNKTEEVRRDENGNVSGRFAYEYDREGRTISFAKMDSSGALVFKRLYAYDDRGNQISEVDYNNKNEECVKVLSKYNEYGALEETSHFSKGLLDYKVLYEYDHKGLLTSTLTVPYGDQYLAEARCVYEYDDHDNWVTETIYDVKKNQTRFITRREIAYYE